MENQEIKAGARIGAMLLDHIVMCFIIAIMAMPVMSIDFNKSLNNTLDPSGGIDWTLMVMIFGMSLYFNKDIIQGKSLAKRALKQEVINNKTREVASPIKCLIRNITIVLWPIEVIAVLINPSRRIGDFIAGTKIIKISDVRNSKPKVNLKQVSVSLFLGFLLLFSTSFLFTNKTATTSYVESSFNEELSSEMEKLILENHPNYVFETNIKVFDKTNGDSIKYVYGAFSLTNNFIDNDYQFKEVKNEIFNSMFQVIPKGEFILKGKFIYDSKTLKKSIETEYDWRNK